MRLENKKIRYQRKTLLRRRAYKPAGRPKSEEAIAAPVDTPQTLAPPGDKGLDQIIVQQ